MDAKRTFSYVTHECISYLNVADLWIQCFWMYLEKRKQKCTTGFVRKDLMYDAILVNDYTPFIKHNA